MKPFCPRPLGWILAALALAAITGRSLAQDPSSSAAQPRPTAPARAPAAGATSVVPAPADPAGWITGEDDDQDRDVDSDDRSPGTDWRDRLQRRAHRHRDGRHGNDVVSVGHDSTLAAGKQADAVVSVLGSSTSAGEAGDVVSVLGNTRVTGPVTNAAVAVLGNLYVDSKVEDAVAVLGNVELGPHAEVDGDVVAVLGKITRDPGAIVHGGERNLAGLGDTGWLGAWVRECLFYGRPLGLDAGLGWAWSLAIGYLALYVVLAMLFRPALIRCVQVIDSEPGHAALTALLAILLTPVVFVLLCVTLIGIAAVPFLAASIFCAGLFGKAVMLAWMGNRVAGQRLGPGHHPAVAVLIGGVLVLLLYVIPVIGMLTFQLLGFFGFGAVLYALIVSLRARQSEKAGRAAQPDNAAAATATASATAAAAATATAAATASAAPFVSAGLPRAGFWIRMGALFIDVILVGIVLRLLHPFGHFHLLLLAIYGAVMWKLKGATIGGRVFDLQVVRLDGRAVDWETAIVRALSCFLSLAVAGLGFIWIAVDSDNQAWHDKIAGTVVVRLPKTPGP